MLPPSAYIKAVKRPYPLLYTSLFMTGFREPGLFQGLLSEPFSVQDMLYLESDWYYALADIKNGGALVFRSWRDPAVFAHAQAEFDRRADAVLEASRTDAEAFLKAYEAFMPAIALIYFVERPVEDALRSALTARTSKEETEELMSLLNTPLRPNLHRQERYDLATASDVAAHAKEYRWLHSRYGDEREYTISEAEQERAGMDTQAFLHEWEEQQKTTGAAIERAKTLIGADADLVDLFQYIIFYRTQRTDVVNRGSFFAIPTLTKRAGELGLSYTDILLCTPEEIMAGIAPARSTLDERTRGFSVILERGQVSYLSGEASREAIRHMEEKIEAVSELKGTVACRGKVEGPARVVDSTNFTSVQEGEVLVTSMTTPQMVPYMKKAAAFVTDEGGVTCHAAILSRELKKPCIIGTKMATKAFRDGDRLEVDADTGVVRRLS